MRPMKLTILALLGAGMLSSPAMAQSINGADNMFGRGNNISVTERPRPEYDAVPIQVGAFEFRPELTVGLELLDNVFASTNGAESDTVALFGPSVSISSTWSRHALNANASVTRREHFDFNDESVWNSSFGADARLDVDRDTNVSFGASFGDLTEPRTSPDAVPSTVEPTNYTSLNYYAGAERAAGRLKLQAGVDVTENDYDDNRLIADNSVVDQDFRDLTSTVLNAQADYAISPDTALFARAAFNTRDYDVTSAPVRDSDGYALQVGADLDIGNLVRGIVAVGYSEQDYDAVAFEDVDGISLEAQLEWFPSDLLTLTLNASREPVDASVPTTGGYFANNFGVNADYELRRNVILSAGANFSTSEYNVIDRDDDRTTANIGVTYLVNNNIGIEAGYSYLDSSSSGANAIPDYDTNTFSVRLVLHP